MSLTDTALKALKPKDAAYIVSDDRGLYVEVLPSGSIVWRYRYRLDGKREKLTLGKYPALTLKNARLKRDEAAHLVALGKSPAQKKQQEKVAGAEDATVADFAERFFKDIQSRDRKDVTMPCRYLEKDILPHIGSKPVRDITAEDVRSVIWRKKEQGFDAAAGQVRGLFKRMFDYALTCGLIQANPVMALPMRHVYRAAARDRALTPDEIRQFLRAMQTSNIRRQFKIAFQLIPDDPGAQIRADAGAVEGRASGRRRMAHPGRELQNRQASHRLPVHPSANAVQGTQAARQQQRLGVAGPWHPDQAIRQQCAEPGAEGVIAGAGDPCLHHPRPAAHRLDSAARAGLAFGCGGESTEPHHRRRAWCLQPGGIRRTAAGDVAGVVGLHRQAGAVGESGDRCRLDVTVAFSFSG